MAMRHVAMFRWVDGVSDDTIAEIETKLSGLPAAIGAIKQYTLGADLGLTDGNFDYAVVAEFETVADYEIYRDDPTHQEIIATLIKPIIAERAAVQFEL